MNGTSIPHAHRGVDGVSLGTPKTAWRSSLAWWADVGGCHDISEHVGIQYMSGALLLGTEKQILYSLPLLLPFCNSPVSQETQTLLQGFTFMLNLYPNITCLPTKGWFPLQEARGCCLKTTCSHQGSMFWHTSVGQAYSFRGWRILPALPVCIYYAFLHFMASCCLFSLLWYPTIASSDVYWAAVPLQGEAAQLRLLSLSQLCSSLTSYIFFCLCNFGSYNPSGTLKLFKQPLCWGEQPSFSCFF